MEISGGQLHDNQMIDAFLDLKIPPLAIIAGKAYGSAKIRPQISDEGVLAVIPSKSNARTPIPHNKKLYAMRNIVESFFCKNERYTKIGNKV